MLKGDCRQKIAAPQKQRAVTPARRAVSGGRAPAHTFSSPPAPERLRAVHNILFGSHPLQFPGRSSLTIYVAGVAPPSMETAPHGGIENDIGCWATPTGEETRTEPSFPLSRRLDVLVPQGDFITDRERFMRCLRDRHQSTRLATEVSKMILLVG